MSSFKDEFAKLSRDQQIEYIRQAEAVIGQKAEDEQRSRDAELIENISDLSDNEFAALTRRLCRDGERVIADRNAEKAAKARGFKVTKE